MSVRIPNSLSGKIIELLGEKPILTAAQINSFLSKTGNKPYTEQAIFKELKKLQQGSVVTKSNSKYWLNLSWVSSLVSLGEKIEENYYSLKTLKQFLPEENEHYSWEFSNLLSLRNFWGHMVIVMLNSSKTNALYSWNPHPWYYHLNPEGQNQVWSAIEKTNAKVFRLIGGKSPLDLEVKKNWGKKVIYSFGESTFSKKQSLYFSCIDNYLLEITLSPSLTRRIENYYSGTGSQQNDYSKFIELLTAKTRVKVKLENNPIKSKRLKKYFERSLS